MLFLNRNLCLMCLIVILLIFFPREFNILRKSFSIISIILSIIVTTSINHDFSAISWRTSHARIALSEQLARRRIIARVVLFWKRRSRVATRVSAYAEDSSTELTDERRLPLIVRSPKNLQKDITARRREGDKQEGRGKEGRGREDKRERKRDSTRRRGVSRNKLRRNSPCVHRAPPLHSTHPSPACIYFWAASFSPEGDLSCPYASSLAGCSISARRVAGNNWQSGGVAASYFRNYSSKMIRGSRQSYGENDYFRNCIFAWNDESITVLNGAVSSSPSMC